MSDELSTALRGSNSLADLAARINAEHEAATAFMQQSLERAINAGRLLIEAKDHLKKRGGEWLPWLREHCEFAERTAQLYMQLARHAPEIRNAVADMSVREAAAMIADPKSETRRLRYEAQRASYTLETPQALLPAPSADRKKRVAWNAAERKWLLAIGPDISRAALKQREQAARESEAVRYLQAEHDELAERAAELEEEAKAIREEAKAKNDQIRSTINHIIGPVKPFTETYDFQCDEETYAELAALERQQLVDRLLAARGTRRNGLAEIERGYWGDVTLMGLHVIDGPPPAGGGWTRCGSPDWLAALFPDWKEADDTKREPAEAAS